MIRLIIFIIEILLAAVLGGILGYAMRPGRLQSRMQILILLTVGSAVFAGSTGSMAESSTGLAQTLILVAIIIATGLFSAGFIAKESSSSSRLVHISSFWMAAAVGSLVGMGSLIKAVLLTGLAYYVLRYLPDVLHGSESTRPPEDEEL